MFTKYQIHQKFGEHWIMHSQAIDLDDAMVTYLTLLNHYENGTGPTLEPRLVQVDYTIKQIEPS